MKPGDVGVVADFGTRHLLQYFTFEHLPDHLKEVSRPFGELALRVVELVPGNPERTVALRKLLEAKDAAVRAALSKVDK